MSYGTSVFKKALEIEGLIASRLSFVGTEATYNM